MRSGHIINRRIYLFGLLVGSFKTRLLYFSQISGHLLIFLKSNKGALERAENKTKKLMKNKQSTMPITLFKIQHLFRSQIYINLIVYQTVPSIYYLFLSGCSVVALLHLSHAITVKTLSKEQGNHVSVLQSKRNQAVC